MNYFDTFTDDRTDRWAEQATKLLSALKLEFFKFLQKESANESLSYFLKACSTF